MSCVHEYASGQLRLEGPCRFQVVATLVCDGCGQTLESDLAEQSAVASSLFISGLHDYACT